MIILSHSDILQLFPNKRPVSTVLREGRKRSTEVKKLQQHYIEQLYKTSMFSACGLKYHISLSFQNKSQHMKNTAGYSGLSQVCLHEEPFTLNTVMSSDQSS